MIQYSSGKIAAVVAAATLLMGAGATTATASPVASDLDTATHILNLSYADFASHPRDAPFDWSTDGCTAAGPSINAMFFPACAQHDFGYRNFGMKGALKLDPSPERRAWIDARFLDEMRRICQDDQGGSTSCLNSANTLYQGVRLFGAGHF